MNKNRTNYFLHGPRAEDLRRTLGLFLQLSQTSGQQGLLIWPTLRNLDSSTISDVLGEAVIKQLKKNRELRFSDGGSLKLVTWTDIPSQWNGPVLAAYPNAKTLDKIDGMYSVTHLVVAGWSHDDIEQWVNRWSAVDLATGQPAVSSGDELSPVVVAGLRMLTNRVNLSMLHPSDNASIVDMFKKLKSAHFKLSPDAIKNWLIQNNWSLKTAEDARSIVQRLNDGRTVRSGHMWADNIVQQLKDEVSRG